MEIEKQAGSFRVYQRKINLGMLNRATHTLLYYRQCAHHSNRKDECQKVNSVQVYNLILQGYANKKNFKKMTELFRCLKEDGINPDATTYALMLSCLGQQEVSENNTQIIRLYLEDLNKEDFTLEDVFSQAEVLEHDLKCALQAVTQVDPNFGIEQARTETKYSCNLVNNLNTTMHSTKDTNSKSVQQVPSPAHGIVTQEMLNKWIKEQFALETSSQLVINSIEKKEESKDTHHYRKILEDWEEKWRSVLHQTFITQLGVMKKSFYGSGLDKRMTIYPYLVSLPPEEFISVMMQEIQRLARGSESFSFTKYMMFRRLGELVYMRYVVKYKKEVGVLDKLKDELADSYCNGPALEHSPVEWPNTVLTSIGKFMYSIILLKVMLWNPLHLEKHVYPAIYEVERTKGYRTVDEIKPSPSLVELYQKAAKPTLTFESIVSPMVCPPIPWVSTNLGGYLLNDAKIVRLPYSAYQQKQRMEECGNQQLYPIMDSLNQLSSIPWRVNKPMLEIIIEFKDRIFWFPHNMDFRGRVYPCPPHLNHLSSDVFRSILKFAKGEKLGPNGLRWLKLHLINLTGFVKREPVDERINYCESIIEDILDSADYPLTGRRWWTKSDEPWQTLAACKELATALRSGNPEEYVSHLPVHQDGSCNGLQHYAALGRDKIGAISVNLAPSKAPQDVYSDVAALVETERQKDAASGNPIAKVLEGHVKRKVIKQTVMTTVYGVTRYGARLQIEKQLKALDDFPASQRWAASHYLVHKTFLCLEKMFTSTKEIQNWFTDCAKIVSETRSENLEYITPLGLPVVQPYSKFVGDQISIGKLPSTFYTDSFMKPNVMKQKNAFPPNFIHSLDSSHMMLTSLHCQQAGITFVSVHDCFWTHACSVNIMNKICRDQFVALHKEPILEDLSRFLQKKFGLSKGFCR
ncbi:DNA-directed RNA polymerase, mitochondrial [Portunus trituberculatus]|uniref:DNA-directed RNA polymerase n=1 Tax=Portunus trituberculatus TaxID=210409 RepID=A0A5B7D088_PORTR|nr:DNA-directed RNA polymerase, mitochondrial [Portunus trituberculatus]